MNEEKKAVSLKFEQFKPAIVLSVIIALVGFVLIVCVGLIPDTSGIITEKLMVKCAELMGEGEYELVTDWEEAGYKIAKPREVEKLIVKDDKSVAFEIITSGFNKDALDILVAMNKDGSVRGVAVAAISESPDQSKKVSAAEFLDRFKGKSGEIVIVGRSPESDGEVEGITSATISSKAIAEAVNIAIETYAEMGVPN
ncbi:MAG: FMN-binding protein [Oscillospiraceae bacterium]|jgi:electron transport complex protein RnfG|nr:FMN-binding protein [Oscillospiraceae bacterium]